MESQNFHNLWNLIFLNNIQYPQSFAPSAVTRNIASYQFFRIQICVSFNHRMFTYFLRLNQATQSILKKWWNTPSPGEINCVLSGYELVLTYGDVFPLLLYSPVVVPEDYHLFRAMYSTISGENIRSYEKTKKNVLMIGRIEL